MRMVESETCGANTRFFPLLNHSKDLRDCCLVVCEICGASNRFFPVLHHPRFPLLCCLVVYGIDAANMDPSRYAVCYSWQGPLGVDLASDTVGDSGRLVSI